GLDRFRELPIVTYSASQGLSNTRNVLVAGDGSVWSGTAAGLRRLNNGQVALYRERGVHIAAGIGEVDGRVMPDHGLVTSLFQDRRGRIWVATQHGTGYLENDRFIPMDGLPDREEVNSMVEDTGGELWIAHRDLGLFHLLRDGSVQQITWASIGRRDFALAL